MVDGVMAPVKGANCSEDVDKFLINLTSATPEQTPLQPVATLLNALPDNIRLILADHSYSVPDGVFSHQEHNVMVYVAGYVARKLQNKVCDPCRHLLSGSLDSTNTSHVFLEKKLYKEATVGLTVPSTLLVNALTGVEAVYRRIVEKVVVGENVMGTLVTTVCSDVDLSRLSCEQCHMEQSIIGLMLRIRLHHTLKENNQFLSNGGDRKNRKTLKFSHS